MAKFGNLPQADESDRGDFLPPFGHKTPRLAVSANIWQRHLPSFPLLMTNDRLWWAVSFLHKVHSAEIYSVSELGGQTRFINIQGSLAVKAPPCSSPLTASKIFPLPWRRWVALSEWSMHHALKEKCSPVKMIAVRSPRGIVDTVGRSFVTKMHGKFDLAVVTAAILTGTAPQFLLLNLAGEARRS